MRLLLHSCCASCLVVPLRYWEGEGWKVSCLFYNPNIKPEAEYERRRGALRKYASAKGVDLCESRRDYERFDRDVVTNGAVNCARCYRLRLEETAWVAAEEGFDAYSTTLTASSRQSVGLILRMGEKLGRRHGVLFVGKDLGHGWAESGQEVRELDLYRQNYCGCLESKADRRLPRKYRVEDRRA